jgi:hypothetical protein
MNEPVSIELDVGSGELADRTARAHTRTAVGPAG